MAVQPVIMPKLGAYVEDVRLTRWLVGEGQEVAPGEAVFELETDKTTAEVEAETSGWLHQLVAVDQAVPIGTTVALVAETREEYATLVGTHEDADEAQRSARERSANPFLEYIDRNTEAPRGVPAPVDAAERAAPAAQRITPGEGAPLVAPRARALLGELGLTIEDARQITGSGPGGRILDRDVAAWAATRGALRADDAQLTISCTIPLRGRRATIARRMVSSLHSSAQLTSVLEIDVTGLVEFRARMNGEGATPPIGVTAIVVKLVAAALRAHPRLNARVTESAIELLEEINVAVAVDTEPGLVAPVIARADRRSVEEINARIVELATRAREDALTPDELAGGTFTVSNGGIHPVDITTAIINPPQCAVLWIGRIRQRPVVVEDGTIAARPTLQACLTFDHRAIDGTPASAFLATFASLVADLPRLPP
jgi:pyruvate/2-oxoglutarate dehydrogenase complex dihydrolipoamide acyltransferase (E2) component